MKDELDNETRTALVAYRMQRARETVSEVPFLRDQGYLSTAINRLYYASFYAASALLLNEHHNVSTHQGVKQQLGLHFIATGRIPREMGRFFSQIFEARHSSDYDDFVTTTIDEVNDYLPKANQFIEVIETLISQKS